jgi:hypothetical protein
MANADLDEILTLHVRTAFSSAHVHPWRWTEPHRVTAQRPQILEIFPDRLGAWVYVSLGIWRVTRNPRLEFCIQTRRSDNIHLQTLTMLWFRHLESQPYPKPQLEPGDVFDVGRGWVDGSPLSWMLVDLPYWMGHDFHFAQTPEGPVEFLQLVPLHPQEGMFALERGTEPLLERLEKGRANTLDPHRPSVV